MPLENYNQISVYRRFLIGKSKKKRVTDKESVDFAYIYINLNDCYMRDIIT